ncbi:hypothetical protein NIIDMKKI_13050 [Mycobacterium kansasii]|uniref:AMP-binding enzyme family protein n=1 Tax=Mycobacterium kansasii TaxID=1768 RepID=A0A1V3XNU6_MYCKA|nr:AMP-binding enzyme family protein [Mycobacterium kansasii 824]OOK80750.1 AMP-binding enzyme family protein [Mycobacterium kansasii]BCI86099.1 hypothetical protein NIIDMKKI_13050 [Mycobacterium kansasii]
MYSTMQEFPLTITAIMRHGCGVHGLREVVTATGDGYRHTNYRDVGQRAAQLANGLRRLGITGDQRVATFMWNNTEHLVAYLAVPSMGAVLHTLNIRLFAEQIVYVANEAEDRVILVDLSLAKLLAPVLSKLDSVHTVIAVGDGDTAPLQASGKTVLRYAEVIDGESAEFDWPQLDENSAAAMCYTSGTTGNPKGVVYSHRSSFLHTMATCTTNGIGVGSSDRVLPIVPMFHANAWGLPYAALMAGADLVLPDRHLDAPSLVHMIENLRPTLAGAVPTIWNDVMHHLAKDPGHDVSSLRLVACGGSAVPESLMRTFEEKHGVQIRQLWGMTETSPMATMAWPPREPRRTGTGPSGRRRASRCAGWRPGSSTTTARCCPTTAKPSARWKFAVRGSPVRITWDMTSRSSTPAGCAPATSAVSTSRVSSRSPTGPRTSSSRAASGFRRSSWRTC